eukprot:1287061-Rhodomonas_salina.1
MVAEPDVGYGSWSWHGSRWLVLTWVAVAGPDVGRGLPGDVVRRTHERPRREPPTSRDCAAEYHGAESAVGERFHAAVANSPPAPPPPNICKSGRGEKGEETERARGRTLPSRSCPTPGRRWLLIKLVEN